MKLTPTSTASAVLDETPQADTSRATAGASGDIAIEIEFDERLSPAMRERRIRVSLVGGFKIMVVAVATVGIITAIAHLLGA